MSPRLMAKSMPLTASSRIRNMLNPRPRITSGSLCTPPTTSSRIRNMLNRGPRSTSGSFCTTITACRSPQEGQDLQGRNPEHNSYNLIRVLRGCEPTGTASVNACTTSVPNLGIYRTSKVRLSLVCCFNPRPSPIVGDAPGRRRQRGPDSCCSGRMPVTAELGHNRNLGELEFEQIGARLVRSSIGAYASTSRIDDVDFAAPRVVGRGFQFDGAVSILQA